MSTATEDTILLTAKANIQPQEGKPAKVEITAYSGGPMSGIPGFPGIVYIDLAGGQLDLSGNVPILADHQDRIGDIAGQATARIDRGTIQASGILTPATPAGQTIIALAKSGVSLQSSVGFSVSSREMIQAGQTIIVNGRSVTGPLTVVRAGKLREISLVPLGADPSTSVTITAKRGTTMANTPNTVLPVTPPPLPGDESDINLLQERRGRALQAAFARYARVPAVTFDGEDMPVASLRAKALTDPSIEIRDVELALFQADLRANTPHSIVTRDRFDVPNTSPNEVLEAALCMHVGGFSNLEKEYGADCLEAASRLGIHSAVDVARYICDQNGLHAKTADGLLRAAASTSQFSALLSNIGHKAMTDGYRNGPQVAQTVARPLDARSFHEHTGIRVGGHFTFDEIGDGGGPLQHALPMDSTFTYRLSTFGRVVKLTRKQLVNDELGGLNEVPRLLGRGCAVAIQQTFFAMVLANANSFFSSGNSNIQEAGSALSLETLGTAVELLRSQVDEVGVPLSAEPRFLLVPPALEPTADGLYASENITIGGTEGREPTGNTFRGKYKPLVSSFLSAATTHASYSRTGWYLLADPNDIAAWGICYLNGVNAPTIEQVDLGADFFGIGYRGFMDWGVCQIDCKGAVFSTGAAAG